MLSRINFSIHSKAKNHGFSTSDNPYLPTDARDGAPNAEDQLKDKDSLLLFVKELVNLHKSEPAL